MDPKISCPYDWPPGGIFPASCFQVWPRSEEPRGPCLGSSHSAVQVGERGLFLPQTSQIGRNMAPKLPETSPGG